MNKFVEKTNIVTRYIFIFSKLNFYWLAFSILGLGVFGIFPSTLALIRSFENSENKNYDISLKSYFKTYKEIFLKSNKIALSVLLWVVIMRINYEILIQNSSYFPIAIPIAFLSSNLLIFLLSLWLIPIYLNYHFDLKNKLRIALLLSLSRIKSTICFLCMIVLIALVAYHIPAFTLFYAGSLLSFSYYKLIYNEINQYVYKTYTILNEKG